MHKPKTSWHKPLTRRLRDKENLPRMPSCTALLSQCLQLSSSTTEVSRTLCRRDTNHCAHEYAAEQFEGLKTLVSSASSILWVTGGDLLVGKNPALAMAHGINAVLMNENSTRNLKFATLDIDDTSTTKTRTIAKYLAEVWTTVATATSRATCETDFMSRRHHLYQSCRARYGAERGVYSRHGRRENRAEFPYFGRMVQSAFETPGLLDSIYFRVRPTCDIALDADEVEIEVKAVGLNMKVGRGISIAR